MARGSTAQRDPGTREGRPSVSVIVPFAGDRGEAQQLVRKLQRLRLREGDEVIVADNSDEQVMVARPGRLAVVAARQMRSSYYARNLGAEAARNAWLLFLDSDCLPNESLLDDYFAGSVEPDVGAVAGEIEGVPDQPGLIPRYARSRDHLRQEAILDHPHGPMAVTANLMVRRRAWLDVGGFHEGIRSTGDLDFSWRLGQVGWRLGYAPNAVVQHLHRATLTALARQFARYGAGSAWAARRHPGYRPSSIPRELTRAIAGVIAWSLTGQFERAVFKAIDGVVVLAGAVGWLMGNVAPSASDPMPPAVPARNVELVAFVDVFPELSETFVLNQIRALEMAGHGVRVEAGGRALHPSWSPARGIAVRFLEDDGLARKFSDLGWLCLRHPLRCCRDLRDRRRWRRQEEPWPLRSLAPVARRLARGGERHIHAYFAAAAALNALRVARLVGIPYSLTAYAYEIFKSPSNLREKLESARFVATVSDDAADHLRSLVAVSHRNRIHRIAMGVDVARFRRRRPQPGSRAVLAVGRLVEKKGFAHLIEAAALLAQRGAIDCLAIAGDGPLRADLAKLAREKGAEPVVRLLGPQRNDEVRDLMEEADVFAMPCVIASDGDRDSLPAVVSEALAMELPVVATDVAGLPEVVLPEWGRVVASGDSEALAEAIDALLSLPVDERIEMGRRARAWVAEHRDPASEAAAVWDLMRLGGQIGPRRAGLRSSRRIARPRGWQGARSPPRRRR